MSTQTAKYFRYRDFIAKLSAAPEQRIVDNKEIADRRFCRADCADYTPRLTRCCTF